MRAVLARLTGPIEPYQIWRFDVRPGTNTVSAIRRVTAAELTGAELPTMREQAWYLGPEAAAFGFFDDQRMVAVCIYWWGERYRQRNFWPLAARQAKLVQIITSPGHRGRGIARRLIETSSAAMAADGFDRLYARVWLTNKASSTAFAAAGWSRIATVIRVSPPWWRSALRSTWGQRPEGSDRPR